MSPWGYLLWKNMFISHPLQVAHVQRLMDINIVPEQFKDPVTDAAGPATTESKEEGSWDEDAP